MGKGFSFFFVVYKVASSWRRHKRRSPDRSALSLLGHPTVPGWRKKKNLFFPSYVHWAHTSLSFNTIFTPYRYFLNGIVEFFSNESKDCDGRSQSCRDDLGTESIPPILKLPCKSPFPFCPFFFLTVFGLFTSRLTTYNVAADGEEKKKRKRVKYRVLGFFLLVDWFIRLWMFLLPFALLRKTGEIYVVSCAKGKKTTQ